MAPENESCKVDDLLGALLLFLLYLCFSSLVHSVVGAVV